MPRLIVVVVEPLYPANVGYIARAMRNFGLSRLRVVNPKLALTGASKYAMHASGIIRGAKTFDNLEGAVKEVDIVVGTTAKPSRSLRNVVRKAISARQFAQRCGSCQATVALIFGREDNGLSNEELRRCDLIVTIPADSKYPTLNLAHAAAILFYELYTHRSPAEEEAPPERRVVEALHANFRKLMKKVRAPDHKRELSFIAFKNTLARSFISRREATLLVGILRRAAIQFPDLNVGAGKTKKTTA